MITDEAINLLEESLEENERLRLIEEEDRSIIIEKVDGSLNIVEEPALERVSKDERKEAIRELMKDGGELDEDQTRKVRLTENIYFVKGNKSKIIVDD